MGSMTEYFDYINKEKITADDAVFRYQHIDIKKKPLQKLRRRHRFLKRKYVNGLKSTDSALQANKT